MHQLLFVTSTLSILIMLIGTTFSYFTVSNRSKYDAVTIKANKIDLALSIEPLYTGKPLIPTNDEDIMTAYKSKCVDINSYGACQAYNISISNFGSEHEIIGQIEFEVDGIENLSYMLLDDKEQVYLPKTLITGDTSSMPLGNNFSLEEGSKNDPTTKEFILVIWLTNLDVDQNESDGNGSFSAAITYQSSYGSSLTGTVNGYGNDNGSTSELETQ